MQLNPQPSSSKEKFSNISTRDQDKTQAIAVWVVGLGVATLIGLSPMIPLFFVWMFPDVKDNIDDSQFNILNMPWLCFVTIPVAVVFIFTITVGLVIRLRSLNRRGNLTRSRVKVTK